MQDSDCIANFHSLEYIRAGSALTTVKRPHILFPGLKCPPYLPILNERETSKVAYSKLNDHNRCDFT